MEFEEAIEKFKEMIKFEKEGRAVKDYYLCEIIAIEGQWGEFPRGFSIISDKKRNDKK